MTKKLCLEVPKLTWSIVRKTPAYSNISKNYAISMHKVLQVVFYEKFNADPAER